MLGNIEPKRNKNRVEIISYKDLMRYNNSRMAFDLLVIPTCNAEAFPLSFLWNGLWQSVWEIDF